MTSCFAYIRVSTVRQGEKGVSLQEQRGAIENFASRQSLEIICWFEERETAAELGRPTFNKMLKLLQQRKADGVIMHKIDRGTRNLRDWTDIRDLNDAGIKIYFSNENIDLNSRGGRLTADIQAVVAADYIYNLKEETKKGIDGRLKQGLLPMGAPHGYLDSGPGKRKEIDPVRGPLIREAFECYAAGMYTLRTLADHLFAKGLRSRTGRKVCINSLSLILNNPFYMGVIRIKRTGETFSGVHEPLISRTLYERVQAKLRSKTQTIVRTHDFLFRGLLVCGTCGNHLVGETQKGHVYYRCHTKGCSGGCIREDRVEERIVEQLSRLSFSKDEKALIESELKTLSKDMIKEAESSRQTLELRLKQISDRLMKLTDAYLDGDIEKTLFEERKKQLLFEQKEVEESVREMSRQGVNVPERLRELLELADMALLSYFGAPAHEKRNLMEILTSNRKLHEKNVAVTLPIPFSWIADRNPVLPTCPEREPSRSSRDLPIVAFSPECDIPTTTLARRLLVWILENPISPDKFIR
jgi:site-specific DNA recombinase